MQPQRDFRNWPSDSKLEEVAKNWFLTFILNTSSLPHLKLVCDTIDFFQGATLLILLFFLKCFIAALLHTCRALYSESVEPQNASTVAIIQESVKDLLQIIPTDDIISETIPI